MTQVFQILIISENLSTIFNFTLLQKENFAAHGVDSCRLFSRVQSRSDSFWCVSTLSDFLWLVNYLSQNSCIETVRLYNNNRSGQNLWRLNWIWLGLIFSLFKTGVWHTMVFLHGGRGEAYHPEYSLFQLWNSVEIEFSGINWDFAFRLWLKLVRIEAWDQVFKRTVSLPVLSLIYHWWRNCLRRYKFSWCRQCWDAAAGLPIVLVDVTRIQIQWVWSVWPANRNDFCNACDVSGGRSFENHFRLKRKEKTD